MRRVASLTPLYFDEDSYLGGGERYPVNLARAVAATGDYEVDVITYGDRAEITELDICDGVRLRVLPITARSGREPLSRHVLAAIRDVDLVHLHQVFSRSSEVAMLLAKLLFKPVCVTDQGGASSDLGCSLGMLELADRVVCHSRFGASLMDTSTPIELVPGGVDDSFFRPARPQPERDRVVFVGGLRPHKGIDRLIAALPADVPLAICGRSHDETYLATLRALAEGKHVTFHDDLGDEDLREMYARAIAVVLPSVHSDFNGQVQPWPELMGLALLEGNACGAPAICSRVGGMPEYVEHGVTGFVFDTLAELTDQIGRLAADGALVRRLGDGGAAAVRNRFGLEGSGRALAAVYDELLRDVAAPEATA